MNKIAVIAHTINDSVVEQRNLDGYINATALSKAYKLATGKRRDVSEWLSNKPNSHQPTTERNSTTAQIASRCQTQTPLDATP